MKSGSATMRQARRFGNIAFAAAISAAAALPSFAADRTISADYALTADETVDGVLTIESGVTVDLAGHNLTVKGLAGSGAITSSVDAAYSRLEYLESTAGKSYINTGYTPLSTTTADLRLRFTGNNMPPANGQWRTVFGTRNTGNNKTRFGVFLYKTGGKVYFWRSLNDDVDASQMGVVAAGVDYYLHLDKDGTSMINGRAFSNGIAADCAHPALLFAMNQNGDNSPWGGTDGGGAGQRLYYCRFAENGTIVHDFVPAKRLADGVLGMYDLTTGEFKTNAGAGEFTGGSEIAERAFATGELHLVTSGGGSWDCALLKVASNVAVVADGGVLAADADWRGLGTVFTTSGETIDLGGLTLKVSGIGGNGTVTDDSSYEYLDYIQGSGSQYINTDYTMGAGSTADFKVQFKGTPSNKEWHGVFGMRAGTDAGAAVVFLYNNNGTVNFWRTVGGSDANLPGLGAVATDTDYTFHIDKTGSGDCTVTGGSLDHAVLGRAGSATCPAGPAYMFNLNQNGSVWDMDHSARMRLYYLTFSENGEIVRNYIPARRTIDNAVGLYETVGHRFYANAGSGSFTAGTATNSAATSVSGQLHVDVPEGVEFENRDVSIQGNLKFVKDGSGAFIASRSNQRYVGGTLVASGEFRCTTCNVENNVESSYYYGAAGTEVTVAEGALMNLDGNGNHHTMKFVLDGGEIRSTSDHGMSGHGWISSLRLTADSKMSGHNFGFVHGGSAAMTVDLGGHTLTIDVSPSQYFYIANTTFTGGGRVVGNTGGWLNIGYYNKACTFDEGVVLDMRGASFNAIQPIAVKDTFENNNSQTYDAGNGVPLNVTGCFRPVTDVFHSTVMKNGSTLDLNGRTGLLVTPSYFSGSKVYGTLTFEDGAEITVDISSRTPQLYEKLVSWNERPETVTFKFDDTTAAGGVPIVVASDGLYYGADPDSQVVDRAWWTGAAGDGNVYNAANWACTNAAGNAVADALPGTLADVRVTGDVSFNVLSGQSITNHTINLDGTRLVEDCDWSGLGSADTFNGTLDLNGNKLKVTGLVGSGTITDTSKGYVAVGFLQGSGSQYINTGYTMGSSTTCDFKLQFTGTPSGGWKGVFGSRTTGSDPTGACVFLYNQGGKPYFWRTLSGDTVVTSLGVVATETDYTFHVDKTGNGDTTITGGSLDHAVFGRAGGGTCAGGPTYIFNLNQNGSVWNVDHCAQMRLYYLTFSENGEVVRDFVPVMRLSDGAYGLYEKKGKQFYGNAGKGAFTGGVAKYDEEFDGAGELIVDVPEGETMTSSTVHITGGVKLVKTGLGTYVSTRVQTYAGGTLVAEGRAQPHDSLSAENTTYSGDQLAAFSMGIVSVASNAVFDVRSNYAYYGIRSHLATGVFLRLDGGTLANSGPYDMSKPTWGGSGIGALGADSSLDVTRTLVFQTRDTCDLGGHTLAINIASGKYLHIHGSSFANGRIETGTTGWLHVVDALDASTVDFKVNSALQIDAQFDVGGYAPEWAVAAHNRGTATMNVHGVFKPASHDCFYGCTLLDGSTVDLANRTTPLPVVSAFTDAGKKTLEFAENATINVRRGSFSGKVIEWTEETKPSTYDTLDFVRDPSDNRSYEVQKRDDGVYILTGMMIIIR